MAVSRKLQSTDLPNRVSKFFATRLASTDSLCIGLSGGCDSVVLLHILSQLGWADRLSVIHVHHGLSPNADCWAAFCQNYCEQLSVPIEIQRVEVALDSGKGLEAAARRARYAAFSGLKVNNLALAQHRGDQAETVLFNLLRGAGVIGAAGMPQVRSFGHQQIFRPLLDVSRQEIESYAVKYKLDWIEDESNQDIALSRNYLRHQVFPIIAQRFSIEQSLAQAAENFSEAVSLLDELAEQDWQLVHVGEAVKLTALRQLSVMRCKNLLRYRLRGLAWCVPSATRLDEFVRQLQTAAPDRHPELILSEGRMYVAQGCLHWIASK